MNLSNYTIKKMIPRLIIAAILVNASFYIAALAVDISNLLGYNLAKLFEAIQVAQGGAGNNAFQAGWETVIGAILAGAGVVALIAVIIMAPTVLLAVAMVAIILVARKALILLLVVIAPIAFVAYLLPNTEDWFKKWYKAFVALLMVFPIISVVFGASTLASKILLGIAADTGGGDTDTQNMLYVVALGVAAVPLFAVPALLKGSLAAAGSIGTKLSNLSDKSNRYARNKAMQGRIGEAKAAFDARRRNRAVNRRLGQGRIASWGKSRTDRGLRGGRTLQTLGSLGSRLDKTRAGKYIGGDRGLAAATSAADKAWDEEVGKQKTSMTAKTNDELLAMMEDTSLSDEQRAAAAGMVMSRDHRASHLRALEIAHRQRGTSEDGASMSRIQRQMAHDMKSQPFALGDQSAGDLVTGDYGSEKTDKTGKKYIPDDTRTELRKRLKGKLSVEKLASMNPDELKSIHKMAREGELMPAELANLKTAIDELRKDPIYKGKEKPEAKVLHDEIFSDSFLQADGTTIAPPATGSSSSHYDDKFVF